MTRRPVSLLPFLRSIGGIREDAGELRNLGIREVKERRTVKSRTCRYLVSSTGLPRDRARELAAEAGYFHAFGPPVVAIAETTPADLIDLIRDEYNGAPAWSEFDADAYCEIGDSDVDLAEIEERTREIVSTFGRADDDENEAMQAFYSDAPAGPLVLPSGKIIEANPIPFDGFETAVNCRGIIDWAVTMAESIRSMPLPEFHTSN